MMPIIEGAAVGGFRLASTTLIRLIAYHNLPFFIAILKR
jgi:hypothetical protein